MKKILANVLFIGLLASMAVAGSNNNNDKNPPAKTASKAQSFDGWVSDEKCGAKIDADCAKKCQALAAKMVFVNSDRTIVPVANQDALKNFPGQHVIIKGKLDNGILTVETVKPAAQ
jgi:hypothetical protein